MVNQETSRLSSAKIHRHQRVQKILASRRESASSSDTSSLTSSDDDHSSSFSTEVFVSKQQQRKLRNRKSAESSRLKKRQDIDTYKYKISNLEHDIYTVQHENALLRSLLLQKHPDILHQFQSIQTHTSVFSPPSLSFSSVSQLPPNAAASASTATATAAATACNSNEFAIQP